MAECWTIFFQNFLFQTNSDFVQIFSQDFYLAILCQYLSFWISRNRFQKCLLFFYPRVNAFLIPSSGKTPGWKISGRFSILRIKSRSTMIAKNCPNKNLSRFLLRTKLRLIFERENRNFLVAHPMARLACWKKRKYGLFDRPQQVIRTLDGFKKLTNVFKPAEFYSEEI